MVERIVLYTAKVCPYAHRVELALEEAGAQYEAYLIDLQNKPAWYAPKVNPASKVPAIAYGGPPVPADQPSPESVKLAESLVLVEFVADLFPNSTLLPKDPVQRTKARFFIEVVSSKFAPKYAAFVMRGEAGEPFFEGVDAVQALLDQNGDKRFAISDEFTIADAAILPFIARAEVAFKNDLGAFGVTVGEKAYERLQEPEYSRFWKYYQDLKARPSFKKTFNENYLVSAYKKRYARG